MFFYLLSALLVAVIVSYLVYKKIKGRHDSTQKPHKEKRHYTFKIEGS